jgi:hypothetical protein
MSRFRWVLGALSVLCVGESWSYSARADSDSVPALTDKERVELDQLKSVTRRFAFQRNGMRYLAALSYQVMRLPAQAMCQLLEQVDTTLPYLPGTHGAQRVQSPDAYGRVQMIHGNAIIQGGYTLYWEPQLENGEIRYWMDPAFPHDPVDIFGFFRCAAYTAGRSLLTVGVTVAPGPRGAPFEDKIHTSMLKSARYLRKYVDKLVDKHRHGRVGRAPATRWLPGTALRTSRSAWCASSGRT